MKVYVANDGFILSPVIVASVMAAPVLLILFVIMMIGGRKKRRVTKAPGNMTDVGKLMIPDEKNERSDENAEDP